MEEQLRAGVLVASGGWDQHARSMLCAPLSPGATVVKAENCNRSPTIPYSQLLIFLQQAWLYLCPCKEDRFHGLGSAAPRW